MKIFGFWLLMVWAIPAWTNTLFEGWSEVYVGDKKVGFVVSRYEFSDNKFKATYYLKTNKEGGDITESLKAFAAPDLTPLSYAYTSKTGDEFKIIDATFKGEVMTLKIKDQKKETKTTKRIKKGTFLSTFLVYLVMQQKDGFKPGKEYSYSAVAEEDGTAYNGTAYIKAKEAVKGKEAFKVLNEFKNEKFFSWVTAKGEPLLTRSPERGIEVRFAESQEQASKGFMLKLTDLNLLFNMKVPGMSPSPLAGPGAKSGGENLSAGKKDEEPQKKPEDAAEEKSTGKDVEASPATKPMPEPTLKPGKAAGVPGGKGLILKPKPGQ